MKDRLLSYADRYGLIAYVVWLAVLAFTLAPRWHADMGGIYLAATFFAEGQFDLIYPEMPSLVSGTPPDWEPELARLGAAGATTYPFVYPPIWAAVFSPLATLLRPTAFMATMLGLQLLAYFSLSIMAHRLAAPGTSVGRWMALTFVTTLYSAPTFFVVTLNQPQITVTFLALASIYLASRGSAVSAGVLLGVAAALKITPILFVVVLLATGHRRAALFAVLTAGGLAALSFALCGWELNLAFVEAARTLSEHVLFSRLTFNVAPILLLLQPGNLDIVYDIGMGGFTAVAPAWLGPVALLGLFATLAVAVRLSRGLAERPRLVALTLTTAVIIAAFGPLGWAHYYILPVIFLPALAVGNVTRGSLYILALALLFLSVGFVMAAPMALVRFVPLVVLLAIALWFLRVWPRRAV